MSLTTFVAKVSSFLILSLYIIVLFLSFILFVSVTSEMALAGEEIIWDDPSLIPSLLDPNGDPAIHPLTSYEGNRVFVTVDVNAYVAGAFIHSKGSYLNAQLLNNTVSIIGATTNLRVDGAHALVGKAPGDLLVQNNTLILRDTKTGKIGGGRAQVMVGPSAYTGDYSVRALNNAIYAVNAFVTGDVDGGFASSDFYPGTVEASDNSVYFEGGQAENIYAGYSYSFGDFDYSKAESLRNTLHLKNTYIEKDAIAGLVSGRTHIRGNDNVLTLEGEVYIGLNAYGSYSNTYRNNSQGAYLFEGNVFNALRPTGQGSYVGANLGYFEVYNFYFSSRDPSGTTAVTVDGEIYLNDQQTKGSRVGALGLFDDGPPVEEAMEYVLLSSTNNPINYDNFDAPTDSTEEMGAFLAYDVSYVMEPNRLLAKVSNFRATDATVIIPEGPGAGLDLITEGSDLPTDSGGDPFDVYGPDDGDDPFDDYGPDDGYDGDYDDGYDSGEDYGPDDGYDSRGDSSSGGGYGSEDGQDPLDRGGRENERNPLDGDNQDDGLGQDKNYPDRAKEASDKSQADKARDDRNRRLKEANARRVNPCPRAFAKAKGSRIKRDDGRELDINAYNLLVGVGCGQYFKPGLFTLGLAFEGGKGDYETRRRLVTGLVRGYGDLDYAGAALIGRFDFRPSRLGRFYLESSVRLGKLNSDFHSSDFPGSDGRKISYNASNNYIGLQLGVGDYINLTRRAYLNAYGQYHWVKVKGGDIKLNTGHEVEVEDINSHRLKGGFQLHRALSRRWRTFIGAAYDYELSGKTKAKIYDRELPTTSKKGGTGAFELGLAFSSKAPKPLTFSLSLQANAGKRQGFGGMAQVGLVF
ncbi:MAG: autotransporter outer membrane beta-barrel domain-containing protein [Deltaproteobacteria bacterium]|nr:autotransporter outer membrane beta-barrel domain-containing protein [Deltaproteobacteria bacterium]